VTRQSGKQHPYDPPSPPPSPRPTPPDNGKSRVVDKGALNYREFRREHPFFEPLAQSGILMKNLTGVDPVKLGVQVGWNDVGPMVASAFTGVPHVGHPGADTELQNVPEEVGDHVNELVKDTVGIDVSKAASTVSHSFKHFGGHIKHMHF
jgi:hypothetical protein